jgi:hypothetical protein
VVLAAAAVVAHRAADILLQLLVEMVGRVQRVQRVVLDKLK